MFGRGATYAVTFREFGLPKGVSWCATIGWYECTTKGSIAFKNLTPWQYSYGVSPVPGFVLSVGPGGASVVPPPGSVVNVTTHAVAVNAKFTPVRYALTFHESGLPHGKAWGVLVRYVYYGRTITRRVSSKLGNISFEVPNGTFPYVVAHVAGYSGNVSGTLSIDGSAVVVNVAFTPDPGGDTRALPSQATTVACGSEGALWARSRS
jgi:hypothetical protein